MFVDLKTKKGKDEERNIKITYNANMFKYYS